ncbi:MAG: SRPBCC domain-containing protein [Bryobacteraceae bacterium]
MSATPAPALENITLELTWDTFVRAPLEATFEALLVEMGPANQGPDGQPLTMVLEAWPGGRWFRDLGADNGHYWGTVQAIKRPTLLEITGPMFISAPVVSNIQYRLKEADGGTVITFRHSALGFIPEAYREGLTRGWPPLLERVRKHAEATRVKQ